MENGSAFNWKTGLSNNEIRRVDTMNYALTKMKIAPTSISRENISIIKSTENLGERQGLINATHSKLKNEMKRRTQESGPKFTDEQRKFLTHLRETNPKKMKEIILTNNNKLRPHNEIVCLLEEERERELSISGGKKKSVKKLKESSVKKKKISKK